jgi:hypothetical protein
MANGLGEIDFFFQGEKFYYYPKNLNPEGRKCLGLRQQKQIRHTNVEERVEIIIGP